MTASRNISDAERDDDPVQASDLYERLIASGQADLGSFLNLSVLYFVANDGGYAAIHALQSDFLQRAWRRMYELLDEAESLYGPETEILFWRHFYTVIWGDTPVLDRQTCEQLLNSGTSRMPVLGLFASFAGLSSQETEQYRRQAEELYQEVREGLTVRERYVRSVLESALANQRTADSKDGPNESSHPS